MADMVIKSDEGKFPNNIQPRKYGPEQRDFLKEIFPACLTQEFWRDPTAGSAAAPSRHSKLMAPCVSAWTVDLRTR